MQPPVPRIDNVAVFLDFDGTLVDFASTPETVTVPSDLKLLLSDLSDALNGALALITGRSLESLDGLLGNTAVCAAGCHGAEWRNLNGVAGNVGEKSESLAAAREALAEFSERHGLLLEGKPYSLALHFRHHSHLQSDIDSWISENLSTFSDLRIINGKSVREVQLAGVHKGVAVERFMQHAPFAGRSPIYIGDDVTDEDAFAWVNQAGGISIKVGTGKTIAAHRLTDFRAVSSWLQQLLDQPAQ